MNTNEEENGRTVNVKSTIFRLHGQRKEFVWWHTISTRHDWTARDSL